MEEETVDPTATWKIIKNEAMHNCRQFKIFFFHRKQQRKIKFINSNVKKNFVLTIAIKYKVIIVYHETNIW
jgi:hypothetical protein